MEPSRHVVVCETEATVICDAFQQRGELSAVAELRRLFPGVTDNRLARECAHTIAGWKPLRPGATCKSTKKYNRTRDDLASHGEGLLLRYRCSIYRHPEG